MHFAWCHETTSFELGEGKNADAKHKLSSADIEVINRIYQFSKIIPFWISLQRSENR